MATVLKIAPDEGPTSAELDAIDAEMPLIRAEIDYLDAVIKTLDRPPNEVDTRRLRRARRRALDARRTLTNHIGPGEAA